MGTVYGDGGEIRIISQVMETIFKKIESLKHRDVFTLTRGCWHLGMSSMHWELIN
jgi:hypothetical protein